MLNYESLSRDSWNDLSQDFIILVIIKWHPRLIPIK